MLTRIGLTCQWIAGKLLPGNGGLTDTSAVTRFIGLTVATACFMVVSLVVLLGAKPPVA